MIVQHSNIIFQQSIVIAGVALVVLFPLLYHILSLTFEESGPKWIPFLTSGGISISFASLIHAAWTPELLHLSTARVTADLLFSLVIFGAYGLIVVSLLVAIMIGKRQNEPIS